LLRSRTLQPGRNFGERVSGVGVVANARNRGQNVERLAQRALLETVPQRTLLETVVVGFSGHRWGRVRAALREGAPVAKGCSISPLGSAFASGRFTPEGRSRTGSTVAAP
jgi:hypothetical protein